MIRNAAVIALLLAGHLIPATAFGAPPAKEENRPFYSSVPSAYMDDPRRVEWQKPEKVIDYLLLNQGEVVADIGAGTGYFSMLFAQRVGRDGLVYAVDVDEDMVTHVAKRAQKEGLNNVRSVLSTPVDPLLPKSKVDLVFICDTYLFFENRGQYLVRLRESLKKEGRLAIVSFNGLAEIPGAPPRQKMVPKEKVIEEAEKAGLALEADYYFLPYQDFLLFRKR